MSTTRSSANKPFNRSAKKRRFLVPSALRAPAPGVVDGTKSPEEVGLILRNLPLAIGEKSACKCGSALRVGDYKIAKSGEDVLFEGIYSCPQCKFSPGSVLGRIIRSISKAWQDMKKVEVSLQGVVYEKHSDKRKEPLGG